MQEGIEPKLRPDVEQGATASTALTTVRATRSKTVAQAVDCLGSAILLEIEEEMEDMRLIKMRVYWAMSIRVGQTRRNGREQFGERLE